MRWLITGGCGFIGTRLVERLTKESNHRIRIIDNLSTGTAHDLGRVCCFIIRDSKDLIDSTADRQASNVELVKGDILDEATVARASQEVDIVVHLAANTGVPKSVENPRLDCLVNVMGTLNCLEAARHNHVRRFLFASSGAPVGECVPPITEEIVPHPVSPYGAGKLAAEAYCSAYYRTFGLETVCLRFGNVYGPGSHRKTSVVAKFIQRAMRDASLRIYGDGSQTRDFIYIDDIVRAIILSAEIEGIGGEVFQIATNQETSVSELTSMLLDALTLRGITNTKVENAEWRTGDVRRNFSDTTKARKILGWKSETSLREGLQETVDYFCSGSG